MSQDQTPGTGGRLTFRQKLAAEVASTPIWSLILLVVLSMLWIARYVMQANVPGIVWYSCLLALCLIAILMKTRKRQS